MAQNDQTMAKKRLNFENICFIVFLTPKNPQKLVLAISVRLINQKIIFPHKFSNFGRNLSAEKTNGQVKYFFFSNLFYRHFIKKLKDLLEPFFLKVQKHWFSRNSTYIKNFTHFIKKAPVWRFIPYRSPTFPKISKKSLERFLR